MFLLKRKVGERIVIAGEITVTVLEVRGRVVRLGIDAPRHVRVDREEVAARIAAEAEPTLPTDTDGCDGSAG